METTLRHLVTLVLTVVVLRVPALPPPRGHVLLVADCLGTKTKLLTLLRHQGVIQVFGSLLMKQI